MTGVDIASLGRPRRQAERSNQKFSIPGFWNGLFAPLEIPGADRVTRFGKTCDAPLSIDIRAHAFDLLLPDSLLMELHQFVAAC